METIGVLLLNLGGPDSLDAVRPFLYNLFSDRLIIKLGPPFMQRPIAALIAATRAEKSRSMYAQIGGASPLSRITIDQAKALSNALSQPQFAVFTGMRYWHPYIEDAVKTAYDSGIREFIALSLYPHYSLATTGSSFGELERVLSTKYPARCRYIRSWPDNPLYIAALTELINEGIAEFDGRYPHIIFSAHALPEYFITQGDPYVTEINKTIDALRPALKGREIHQSYQSRSGPVKWLEPSTEVTIEMLAGDGIKDILVVPISFVSDHIETLYEIDIFYRDFALKRGIILKRVKSLNTHPVFIQALKTLINEVLE
ncbi:ferrochelatase [Candidatus Magnetominusculus xianensis]|uniref:Ferrochelatase n=1 Tax=Candidatus Magnetominusculus xianensis TaxID=1748249 RepID=A0ABR5SD13_9BACT|nr:ferrochelatase [Candidatus Magnetominusculus xianensis]KWT82595.1 ferrochelatase [Candidatus Magnetominusculus xianensis]MBF0405171.1 ferrochelatase [Nitrospirota bacterium]